MFSHVVCQSRRCAVQLIMTFTLVSVVYAAAVAKPGHGNCAPLAIGFTLFASAFVGGQNTSDFGCLSRTVGLIWTTVATYIVRRMMLHHRHDDIRTW